MTAYAFAGMTAVRFLPMFQLPDFPVNLLIPSLKDGNVGLDPPPHQTPDETRRILERAALDWIHEEALRKLADERLERQRDYMQGNAVSFALREDIEGLENRYDHRA